MSSCACFIGNLLNGSILWNNLTDGCKWKNNKDEIYNFYTGKEIHNLEHNFLFKELFLKKERLIDPHERPYINNVTEEGLYLAMESTLLMLRKIHEDKGEIVKDYNFTKRKLTI